MSIPGVQVSVRFDAKTVQLGIRKLADALPQLTREELDDIMEKAKFEASGGYSGGNSYTVPTVYGQVYQRTGNLGRSTYVMREGLTYRMKSEAFSAKGEPYSSRVLGRADGSGQTWAFVGRWPNMAAVMRKWADVAIERMRSVLDALIGDFGL